MYFKEAELLNFRNYISCKAEFHRKVNLFTGKNGNGKTNFAEALSLMCLAKSFRGAKERELIRFDQKNASVKVLLCRDERDYSAEIIYAERGREIVREIKINGAKKNRSDLPQYSNVVFFSPEDLKIVKEEPEKRRRFLNRELCQMRPVYYESLLRYTKILNQRNNLLKQEIVDDDLLSAWSDYLVYYGTRLMMERQNFIEKLKVISKDFHSRITDGKENLDLHYGADVSAEEAIQSGNEEKIREIFHEELLRVRDTEKKRRTTMKGPHRDDLHLQINGIDVRQYASQGQQRTAALALKLAEIQLLKEETREDPVLILDDVLSELDETRQNFLLQSLSGVQLFMTSTELNDSLISQLGSYKRFYVESGKIIGSEEK